MLNLAICPKCFEKHEWFNIYIEQNAKLHKVKNHQIAWCKNFNEFISKEIFEITKLPLQEIFNN